MTLREKRVLLTYLTALLILKARDLGYEIALNWCRRPEGIGNPKSLHLDALAVDMDLYKQRVDGRWYYCMKTEDHRELGEWWEDQHELASWGGRFTNPPDGNHYSIAHRGMK